MSSNLLRAFVHGDGADEPLLWYEVVPGGVSRRYFHRDERGSVTAIADQSGNAVAVNAYDEYGIPGSGNLGRFGYTGQAWIPELGMWYYKARMYSPTLGRFMQTDPIGYADGMNWYGYVGSDPVNWLDWSGLNGNQTNNKPPKCTDQCPIIITGDRGEPRPLPNPTLAFGETRSGVDRLAGRDRGDQAIDRCDAPLPDGSTVNKNVDQMKRRMAASLATIFFGLPAPVAVSFAYWFNKVRKGGAWDYKRHGGTEAQGNLNYGATGELLFSLDTLLRAAGAVQDHPAPNIHGHWYDFPPSNYGDQAEDIPDIKEGFSRCHGTSG